jgi:hypothetical protein
MVMLHSEGVTNTFFCVVCTKVCQFTISVGHLLEIAPNDPQFYVYIIEYIILYIIMIFKNQRTDQ